MPVSRSSRNRTRRSYAYMEALESRTLMSATITTSPLGFSSGGQSALDSHGDLWIADLGGNIDKIHKNADGTTTTTAFPAAGTPWAIVFNPKNSLIYVADENNPVVTSYNLNGAPVATFTVTTTLDPQLGLTNLDQPVELATTSDGAVWFTTGDWEDGSGSTAQIGRIDPSSGNIVLGHVPTLNAIDDGIHVAADGSLWVGSQGVEGTDGISGLNHVTWNSATNSMTINHYDLPQMSNARLTGAAIAPDGSIWYALTFNTLNPAVLEQVDKVTFNATSNTLSQPTVFNIPNAGGSQIFPTNLTFNADGSKLWFTGQAEISNLNVSTSAFDRTPTPDADMPMNLALTSTDLWATSFSTNVLYHVTLGATTPPTPVDQPIVASQHLVLHPLFGRIFLGIVATFTDAPTTNAGEYKISINWGDGTTSTGIVMKLSSGNYVVIGLHAFSKKGTFAVCTTITDTVDGDTALATASITFTK